MCGGSPVGHPLAYGMRDPEVLDAVAAPLRPGEVVEVVPGSCAARARVRALPGSGGDQRANSAVALFFRDLTQARRLERRPSVTVEDRTSAGPVRNSQPGENDG